MNVAQEFEPLYRAAKSLSLDRGTGQAALVTITRTRGSTFRRAGASMLVHNDGTLVCELSGGCPQRDIVLRAQRAMESGEPAVVTYGRDSNYDVMIETGCGGELEVLIEPWREPGDVHFLDAIEALRAKREPGTMASLYGMDDGVAIRRPLRLVHGGNSTWTNIRHEPLKKQVIANLTSAPTRSFDAATSSLENEGQRYDVLVESLRPPHAMVIVGDGISATMLARLSLQLGWNTTLVTTHQTAEKRSDDIRRIFATPRALTSEVIFDDQTSVVVMTHRLELDLAYVTPLMSTAARYIGVIGSRQRAEHIRAALPQVDERLHVPAGLDVGSETPQEIALAIAAEILASRNGRHGGSLVRSQTSIHP